MSVLECLIEAQNYMERRDIRFELRGDQFHISFKTHILTTHKMPTYVYQEILPDGSDGEVFEYIQGMAEDPLTIHPKTGNPVRKIFHSPNVSNKYTEGSTKNKLTDENVEKHGFTRYEKDKLTGRYNKTAGKDKRAPDVVDANQLKKIQQNGLD